MKKCIFINMCSGVTSWAFQGTPEYYAVHIRRSGAGLTSPKTKVFSCHLFFVWPRHEAKPPNLELRPVRLPNKLVHSNSKQFFYIWVGWHPGSLKHKESSRLWMGRRPASLRHKNRFEFERQDTLDRGNIKNMLDLDWETPWAGETSKSKSKFMEESPCGTEPCKNNLDFNVWYFGSLE